MRTWWGEGGNGSREPGWESVLYKPTPPPIGAEVPGAQGLLGDGGGERKPMETG